MSWENVLKNLQPVVVGGPQLNLQAVDQAINSHKKTFGNGSWFSNFASDLEELKKLMQANPRDAQAKWKDMQSDRKDIIGTFEAIEEEYQKLDRLFLSKQTDKWGN